MTQLLCPPLAAKVVWVSQENLHEEYGRSISVLTIDSVFAHCDRNSTPDSAKIWLTFRPNQYNSIPRKGDIVQVLQDGQGRWVLVGNPPIPITNEKVLPLRPRSEVKTMPPDKPPMLEAGSRFLDLYAHFRQEAIAKMPDADPETVRASVACTVIFLQREFGASIVADAVDGENIVHADFSQPSTPQSPVPQNRAPAQARTIVHADDRPDPPKSGELSQAQIRRLYSIGSGQGLTSEGVKLAICDLILVTSTKDIPISLYDKVCEYLQSDLDVADLNHRSGAGRRLKEVAKNAGFSPREGVAALRAIMGDVAPGKESWQLNDTEELAIKAELS